MMPNDAADNVDPNAALGPNSPAAVIEALVAQVSCYQRLAKLTSAQHEHVQRGQTDQLLTVLRARQEVLDQATEFEQRIAPAKRDWSNFLGGLEVDQRSRAETLLRETRRLLETITSADRDDALVLQRRKLNIGKQLNKTAAARMVNRRVALAAYGAPKSRLDLQQ
jgi:hypothetical protein